MIIKLLVLFSYAFYVVDKQMSARGSGVGYGDDARRYMLHRSNSSVRVRRAIGSITECGIIDEQNARIGEQPWHAGIYRKTTSAYNHICGGTLINSNVVVSAAKCFWTIKGEEYPASRYAVGVGKLYQLFNDYHDQHSQKLDVKQIKIPDQYQGKETSYRDDIALVIVAYHITFNTHVKPVCVDFSEQFVSKYQTDGNVGKISGWGFSPNVDSLNSILRSAAMYDVDTERCRAESSPEFKPFITYDKLCAGFINDIKVCRGITGGGLVVPELKQGIQRYYLRGIFSTMPSDKEFCNDLTWATFTNVLKHAQFITSSLSEAGVETVRIEEQQIASPPVTYNLIGVKLQSAGRRFCEAPPQPTGGTYTLEGVPHPIIENTYESFKLTYSCYPGFLLRGEDDVVLCKNGDWIYTIPECVSIRSESSVNSPPTICEVPPHPHGGKYIIENKPNALPGEVLDNLILKVTCTKRYTVEGTLRLYCVKGQWSDRVLPKCVHITSGCALSKHPSIDYHCKNDIHSIGQCQNEVPSGVTVQLQCKPRYEDSNLWRISTMHCVNGDWESVAVCTPKAENNACRLHKHPSVEYRCLTDSGAFRVCDDVEPARTTAVLRCRNKDVPIDHLSSAHIFCTDGNWNHQTACSPSKQNTPECGIQTIDPSLVYGGKAAVLGELPWHAGIFDTKTTPYEQICGGSLVSSNLIISAAHCFWDDLVKKLPASNFAVAVGKLFRSWDDKRDVNAQKSDVSEIIIPDLYQHNKANYQEDIALLRVVTPFIFERHVKPVCLEFDFDFASKQLKEGNFGKVGGWGLTSGNESLSPVLRSVEMLYIPVTNCLRELPEDFSAYLTGDKICAGTKGTAVCRGDSGGGLTFRDTSDGIPRFYLEGIVSTSPGGAECGTTHLAAFTNINRHHDIINRYL